MKLLLATGIVLALLLAYTLAVGKGGLLDIWNMKRDISAQQEQNERLKQRNRELAGGGARFVGVVRIGNADQRRVIIGDRADASVSQDG